MVLAALAGFGLARWIAPPVRHDAATGKAATPAAVAPATAATPPALPPVDTSKPAAERLKDAVRGNSPLAAAPRALAVLDAMTAEDFHQLAAKPGSFYPPWVGGADREFSRAFMDALVARWLAVDPPGAFAAMQKLEAELKKRHLAGNGEFLAAIARLRPELLLGGLAEKGSWDRFDQTIPAAFTTLASRDPAAARGYLDRVADPEQRKAAEVAIAQGIAKSDPVAAVGLARTLESEQVFQSAIAAAERIGPGVLRQVLTANERKFPIGFRAAELVLRYPDEDWSAFVGDAPEKSPGLTFETMREAQRHTPEERQRVLARLDEFPPAVRTKVATALVQAWTREDPRQATEWAFAHAAPGAAEDQALAWAFNAWSHADRTGAVEWWSRLPASALRDQLGGNLASALAFEEKFDEAIQFFQPKPGAESAELTANIARSGADHDPARVAQWLDSLPPGSDTTKAVGPLLEKWVPKDAAAAAKWVEAQPAGPRREAALQAYTRAAAASDPAAAAEWAAAIADPQMRARAAEYVFATMARSDPDAARAWLRALPGVDESWRERLIRLGR